jgi:hypothetical protein
MLLITGDGDQRLSVLLRRSFFPYPRGRIKIALFALRRDSQACPHAKWSFLPES